MTPTPARIFKLICLIALSGCSTSDTPPVVVRTVVQIERVPAALITPCPQVAGPVNTNNDLVNQNVKLKGALSVCASKVQGVAIWDDTNAKSLDAPK